MACTITTTSPIKEEEEQLANCALVWQGGVVYRSYQKEMLDDLEIYFLMEPSIRRQIQPPSPTR